MSYKLYVPTLYCKNSAKHTCTCTCMQKERERVIFYQILDRIRLRLYKPSHTLEALNKKTQERVFQVPQWDCFLWTYLLSISERNRQYEGLYKYVVGGGGGGGRGVIIVSGSKHACLIISCNVPIFILPISVLLTESPKYSISFAATRQNVSHHRNSYASLSVPGGITSIFWLKWFFWFLKIHCLYNFDAVKIWLYYRSKIKSTYRYQIYM